ncbi:hypothetical protein QEJ31_10870 [Pigmentibacter sp. JX0631]|uniref:hypothetical protein n=1 Tax=Pigmentibacter sp. JX0631 TaxID=2976982 RepID=UPI002468EE8C|nr:hypothetical protein [Pigmentibacter sp. JX0631]WGL59021.1 hypothetical protein QEJ31_10870 [Pigmentibacter sp. JX0631]
MVFFQSMPRINKNLIKKHILTLEPIKNSKGIVDELVKNSSFALVCLFLKFVKEDYFTYGELSSFKMFFEEKRLDYINFLIKCQETKHNIQYCLSNQEDLLLKYNSIIGQLFPDYIIDSVFEHEIESNKFSTLLDREIAQLIQENKYSKFYFIKENCSENFYAVFLYNQYQKINIILYNPRIGLKKFLGNELDLFKETFDKLLKKGKNNYTSFRIKIYKEVLEEKTAPCIEAQAFYEILQNSANKFTQFINDKNYIHIANHIKDELAICESMNKVCYNAKDPTIFNIFINKKCELIHKIKNNLDVIYEKSFWIIFLIHFYSLTPELKEEKLCNLDSFLGKEKIYDFLVNFYNKKCSISHYQSKKITCLIIIHTYKKMLLFSYRIPYFLNLVSIQLNYNQIEEGKKLVRSIPKNIDKTLSNWHKINIIFNERHISKRFNGTFQSMIGFENIGRVQIPLIAKKMPTIQQLENHFLTSTNCNDLNFIKYCTEILNQNIFEYFKRLFDFSKDGFQYLYNFPFSNIFLQKSCPNLYDIALVYYIDELKTRDDQKKLLHPIFFTIAFAVELKEDSFQALNFQTGFLNTMIFSDECEKFQELLRRKMLENK